MSKRIKRNYGYIEDDQPQRPTPRPRKEKKKRSVSNKRSSRQSEEKDWSHITTPLKRLGSAFLYILFSPFILLKKLLSSSRSRELLAKVGGRTILYGGILGVLAVIGLFAWVSKDLPDPDRLTDRQVAQSTKIYDATGDNLLYEIFAEQKRTLVELDQIPQHIIDGVIATEDSAFYEHHGIRPLSIFRSFVYGVIGKGRLGGGASTLTQQLVKNAILSPERTITRKAKEIILSIRLEQKYSKDQILKIYFNEIPYGSTNYGIQSAAQSYFGKNVWELSLAEGAVLAGFPKAPTHYLNNHDSLKLRRDFVLRRMFEEGYITQEEKDAAQAEPLELKQSIENIRAPHFVLYVKEQLVEKYGEQKVDTGGLKVYTSLDWTMQQKAEKAVEEQSELIFEEANANNTALLAMNPKNGHIVSMVGSRDFFDDEIDGQFNVATLGKRQPGSSFKPIIYTAAFEKGYTPETVVFDVVTNFSSTGRSYQPLNYDLQEHGPVSFRQALQGSLNIPAVKALYLVGEKKGVEFAERLGYSTLKANNFGLSLVLGGGEVHLLEHVRAFSIFANGGKKTEPVSILKVEDANGDILFEHKDSQGEQVLDKKYTDMISNVLSDDGARAYAFGANGVLTLAGRPVAAKTGTTNNYVDAWTIGYTPSLVAGVWAGNTNNSPMNRGFGGSRVAAPIWKSFMTAALADTPVEEFPPAPKNDAEKAVLRGSAGGNITLKVDKVTGKLATSSTPENYIVERSYIQPHSILHYVDKDNPRGPVPEHPENDPQYTIWENAIQEWIRKKQEENPDWEVSFEDPPTEYDDLHSLELIPTLEVVYPAPSSTISTKTIHTDIRVSAPRGVKRVIYRVDKRYVSVERSHPFNMNKELAWLDNGEHEMIIIVEDDVGNRIEETFTFFVQLDENEQAPIEDSATTTEEEQNLILEENLLDLNI